MGVYIWTEQATPTPWTPGANTVAYWRFEENLEDSSGTSPTYNLIAPRSDYEYITGVSGKALQKKSTYPGFYSSTLTDSIFSGNFTLMFFMKFDQVNSVARIMGCSNNYTNIQYESGQGGLQWYNNGEAGRTKWSWTPSTDTWYHIAITGDGTAYTAYLDGNAMTKNAQGNVLQSNSQFVVGNNSNSSGTASGNSQGFLGALDEVIIEDKIWTQSEIQDYLSQFTY